jgi:CheY-like chemotaxis protein
MSSGTNDKRSVLIADDSDLIQLGVRRLLRGEPSIEVGGSAVGVENALQVAGQLKPQIILLDLQTPDDAAFEPEVVKATLLRSAGRIIAMFALARRRSAVPRIAVWGNDTLAKRNAGTHAHSSHLGKSKSGPAIGGCSVPVVSSHRKSFLRETLTG